MSKKKDPEVEVKVEPVAEPVGKPPRFWNGFPVLDCPEPQCKFDALYENELQDHIARAHTPPPAPTPVRTLVLTDRFGNEQKES